MENSSDKSKSEYARDHLIRLPAYQLKVGMFVAELDRPWLETPFVTQGFTIRNADQALEVAEHCDYVYVAKQGVTHQAGQHRIATGFTQGDDRPNKANQGSFIGQKAGARTGKNKPLMRSRPPYENIKTASEEHADANAIYNKGLLVSQKLLYAVEVGEKIDTAMAEDLVAEIVDSVIRNADALLWMTHRLKGGQRYGTVHALNVCILAVVFGRHLNFPEKELQKLGMCGLWLDVGKMTIPTEILNKAGSLTKEETRIMQNHPAAGHDALLDAENMPPLALEVILHHHERPDGRGYPKGLKQHEISEFSRMIAVVDTYDALIGDRLHAVAKTAYDAQKIIYDNRGKQFDEECALQFMQAIGPYPPGTWVELHNGMVGAVLAGLKKFRHLPTVILVLDGDKKPIEQETVALSLTDTRELDKGYLIKHALVENTPGLHLPDIEIQV